MKLPQAWHSLQCMHLIQMAAAQRQARAPALHVSPLGCLRCCITDCKLLGVKQKLSGVLRKATQDCSCL